MPAQVSSKGASSEPLLVRLGVRYFRSLSTTLAPAASSDAVHFLNPEERKALRSVQRGAVLRAAIAGAISTLIAAVIEVTVARPLLGARPRYATLADQTRFYAVVAGTTIVTSVLEILYLYWDGLRAVHRLSREAGLDLFPEQDDDKALAGAMARAALELPNPTATLFGVDPRREASHLRLLLASIVYKLKVSVTNFVAKALVRRMLGRAFVRSWLPFVAVPFTAAWNAWVCWLILREARIRAMGPSAAREMIEIVFYPGVTLSPAGKTAALRAVASSIVRTEELHPNLAALLREVARRVHDEPLLDPESRLPTADEAGDLDDTRAFLAALAKLAPPEQTIIRRILAVASVIDGRLTRAEKRLLVEAASVCGAAHDLGKIEALRRAFVDGKAIERQRVTGL